MKLEVGKSYRARNGEVYGADAVPGPAPEGA